MSALVPQKKLEAVLRMRLDSPALREALDAVATFYGKDAKGFREGQGSNSRREAGDSSSNTLANEKNGNTLAARRELRVDLERRGLDLSKEFLTAFSGLKKKLDAMNDAVDSLDRNCTSIESQLNHAEESTALFMNQSEKLREEKDELEKRSELVTSFLSKYQLSEEELVNLRHAPLREHDGGAPFFDALERLQAIRGDSSEILSTPFHSAGLEILEELASMQEAAYARLYQYVKEHCQSLEKMEQAQDRPAAMNITRRAISFLRERPEYFQDCIDAVVRTRQAGLRRAFISALTRGGPNGTPRPIDMHAHDAVRYLSDMLAWIHVSIASETDVLVTMFGKRADSTEGDGGNDRVGENVGAESMDYLKDALQGIFDVLSRPLSSRLLQVSSQSLDMVVMFQAIDVLKFYSHTVGNLLPKTSRLLDSLNTCCERATSTFNSSLGRYASNLTGNIPPFASNLSAVGPIVESSAKLKKMCKVHAGSLVPEGEKNKLFKEVLANMIEPLRLMCTAAARGLDDTDMACYMINNLNVIVLSISTFPFAQGWADSIRQQIESWLSGLVTNRTKSYLQRSNVLPILTAIQGIKSTRKSMESAGLSAGDESPLSSYDGMSAETVRGALVAFHEGLGALEVTQFSKIDDYNLKSKAGNMVSMQLCDAYRTVHNEVSRPSNGYGESVWKDFTVEKVETLLG